MGKILIGVNMEYIRGEDKPFDEGVKIAAEIGYEYVEPMVHTGRQLLGEAGYFHSFSMEDDPLEMKEICDHYGVKISGLSAHCPLMRPEISVPYLTQAIRFAADLGTPIVNTDEGPKPKWMDDELAHQVMKYTLTQVMRVAERHGIYVGLEDHQIYTKSSKGLMRILDLVQSPLLQVNWDAGNAFLGGEDPYEYLEAIKDRLYHLHAKDIGGDLVNERGKLTGTPVGVACGDGVIDWKKIIDIVKMLDRDIVFSVECGTRRQAVESLAHLKALLA